LDAVLRVQGWHFTTRPAIRLRNRLEREVVKTGKGLGRGFCTSNILETHVQAFSIVVALATVRLVIHAHLVLVIEVVESDRVAGAD
jgi:hypothetical protein